MWKFWETASPGHPAEWCIYASVNDATFGPDNGLSPIQCQAIIWSNAGILLIESLGTNFSEIWIRVGRFSLKKTHSKLPSEKRQPFVLNLNELTHWGWEKIYAILQTTFSNARISLKISLKFVPKVRINTIPALVQIMSWHWPGDKPLSEPMMVCLLMHICVTRSQWVNVSSIISYWYKCLQTTFINNFLE